VGVDDIVANALAEGVEGHFGGEFGQVGEELILVEGFWRAGGDGDDVDAGAEGSDLGGGGTRSPGEDVDWEAEAGEVAGELTDVDVHPAGVFAAEGGEGGRMDADLSGAAQGSVGLVAENRRTLVGGADHGGRGLSRRADRARDLRARKVSQTIAAVGNALGDGDAFQSEAAFGMIAKEDAWMGSGLDDCR